MKIARRRLLGAGLALLAMPGLPIQAAPASKSEKIQVKSTLENLQAAYQGESSAMQHYLAFARKADEEEYGKVASLFRAAAKSESIQAKNHAEAIQKLKGQVPKAEIRKAEVKATRDNLQAALKGANYEYKTLYPAWLGKAKAEKKREAIVALNYGQKVEAGLARLFTEALDNLAGWKTPNEAFHVCTVCGNTVAQVNFTKCPVCMHPREDYVVVK